MRQANALRGEVALELGDITFLMRPEFQALVAAEAEVGSLFGLLERAGTGEVRLADMVGLFWHCLGEPALDRAAFEKHMAKAGIAALLGPYRALLSHIFNPE